jgi:hypothetical protein
MSTSKETGGAKARPAAKSGVDKDQRADASGRDEAATPVSDPNASVTDERNGSAKYVSESQLTTEAIIQRRTATIDGGPEWPADGKYHKVFTVATPRVSTGKVPELDWDAEEHEAMHEANKVAVLQEALNRGLHPRGEAEFVGPLDGSDPEAGQVGLEYTVEVVPATSDGEEAANTYTPSAALADQGGSSLPEFNAGQDERK